MADLKHSNGSVITGVSDDQVENLVSFGWTVVGDEPERAEKPADEPVGDVDDVAVSTDDAPKRTRARK